MVGFLWPITMAGSLRILKTTVLTYVRGCAGSSKRQPKVGKSWLSEDSNPGTMIRSLAL
jgi:hypothetical protein